jgi:hypothetical protein
VLQLARVATAPSCNELQLVEASPYSKFGTHGGWPQQRDADPLPPPHGQP